MKYKKKIMTESFAIPKIVEKVYDSMYKNNKDDNIHNWRSSKIMEDLAQCHKKTLN